MRNKNMKPVGILIPSSNTDKPSENKKKMSAEIQKQVDEYLGRGGEIEKLAIRIGAPKFPGYKTISQKFNDQQKKNSTGENK